MDNYIKEFTEKVLGKATTGKDYCGYCEGNTLSLICEDCEEETELDFSSSELRCTKCQGSLEGVSCLCSDKEVMDPMSHYAPEDLEKTAKELKEREEANKYYGDYYLVSTAILGDYDTFITHNGGLTYNIMEKGVIRLHWYEIDGVVERYREEGYECGLIKVEELD